MSSSSLPKRSSGSKPRYRVFRLSPTYYSFLSAALVATAVNFYTSVVAPDTAPAKAGQLMFAAACTLVASGLFALLAVEIETLHSLIDTAPSSTLSKDALWADIVSPRIGLLRILLGGAVGLCLIGLGGLAFPK